MKKAENTNFFRDLQSSINDNSPMSVSNITLLLSALIGVLLGFVVSFCLVYDVVADGKIDTDLVDLGVFLLCGGGYIASSGVPKTIIDAKIRKKYNPLFVKQNESKTDDDNEENSEEDE